MPSIKDPRSDAELTKAFTLVFAGDIRKFKMNPLTTETPWGIPYAVSMGDALEDLDKARGEFSDELREIDERNSDGT